MIPHLGWEKKRAGRSSSYPFSSFPTRSLRRSNRERGSSGCDSVSFTRPWPETKTLFERRTSLTDRFFSFDVVVSPKKRKKISGVRPFSSSRLNSHFPSFPPPLSSNVPPGPLGQLAFRFYWRARARVPPARASGGLAGARGRHASLDRRGDARGMEAGDDDGERRRWRWRWWIRAS